MTRSRRPRLPPSRQVRRDPRPAWARAGSAKRASQATHSSKHRSPCTPLPTLSHASGALARTPGSQATCSSTTTSASMLPGIPEVRDAFPIKLPTIRLKKLELALAVADGRPLHPELDAHLPPIPPSSDARLNPRPRLPLSNRCLRSPRRLPPIHLKILHCPRPGSLRARAVRSKDEMQAMRGEPASLLQHPWQQRHMQGGEARQRGEEHWELGATSGAAVLQLHPLHVGLLQTGQG